MDTVLQFVEHTKKRDISMDYENPRILQEAIIKEQFQGGKQLQLDSFFKTVQPWRSADAAPSSVNTLPASTSHYLCTTTDASSLELESSSFSE